MDEDDIGASLVELVAEEEEEEATALGYPDVLAKACWDNQWSYKLRLRTGEVVAFRGARMINDEWVHLLLCERGDSNYPSRVPGVEVDEAQRGVDLRLAEIAQVWDASGQR